MNRKVVYFVRHPGIVARTPHGWDGSVVAPRPDEDYPAADIDEMAAATVLVVGLDRVPAAVFRQGGGLKLIQRLGVGYCNVDLAAAGSAGVQVCNMPDFNAVSVAEHTIMLILALSRRLFESCGTAEPTNCRC